MAFNTTAASNTPDLKRLPISALHPGLPSLATQSIVAIVTLVWPYSSGTRSCALLLAEPDFRLRRRRGQVRVQFFADAAHAVATSGVGIGDVVVLRLGPGVQWLSSSGEEEVVRTPGKSVEWELGYRRALRLRAWRDGELLASLDVRGEETPERQVEEAEEEQVYNTLSKIVGRFNGEALKMGSWASPAFLKRSRLSLDSVRDGHDIFADEDGYVEGKGRKKRKSWMNVGMWTYANRTPSPEKSEGLSVDGAVSPTPEEDAIAIQPDDILHTPESTEVATEVDEDEELVPEHTNNEAIQDHVGISPSAAPGEAAELLKEEAIDQQYLTDQRGLFQGDTEENTEVDELPSEPEERMEGQLSFQELKAIERDQSSTEEDQSFEEDDEPPLLVPGELPQTQGEDYPGDTEKDSDTEEDSDGVFFQVKELDRSVTPTEVDSDEDEEFESEEESAVENQVASSPRGSLPVEDTAQMASSTKSTEATVVPQSSATSAMLPPVSRPSGVDESATTAPPRTPKSSAVGPDRAPPTPQLQPVTSMNLPLPSPFPGTGTSEPTSYMDARPLTHVQDPVEAQKSSSQDFERLPVVEEEEYPKEVQPQDTSSTLTEPFPFGLDGSALSKIGIGKAPDAGETQHPAGDDAEPVGQDDVARLNTPDITTVSSEILHRRRESSPSKDIEMDDVVQSQLEENQPFEQITVISDKAEMPKKMPEAAVTSREDQSDALARGSEPTPQDSAQIILDDVVGADGFLAPQDAVDDLQPQSLSFDDGYVPMIDDWDMPNLNSDPEDDPTTEAGGQDSIALTFEEHREKTPVDDFIMSPQSKVEKAGEKATVGSPSKPAKPEVTIVDLSDSEDDESDSERATTTEAMPHDTSTVQAPAPDENDSIQTPLALHVKLEAEETPAQEHSSRMPSPSKSSQQRFRTPFSDVDHMDLSQSGTPRRLRPVATPASQASSIADRVSSRRRRKEVKDSECEWDSTASVSTQKPSSPPSEATDGQLLENSEPVEAARLQPWDDERYSSPFTSQILEDLSQRPPEELSKRPFQSYEESKQSPQKSPPASTVERFASVSPDVESHSRPFASQILGDLSQVPLEEPSQHPSQFREEGMHSPHKPIPASSIESSAPASPDVEQTAGAPSVSSDKVHERLPAAEQFTKTPSETFRYAGESSPALENFRNAVHDFVRSSSPLPEHEEATPVKQSHSSMLVDDSSMMHALQTSQAPFSTQLRNRMTSSPAMEESAATIDSTQAENTMTQKRTSSPARSPSAVPVERLVADRSSPVSLEAGSKAASSAQYLDSPDQDVKMEDEVPTFAEASEQSQAFPHVADGIESACRFMQESLLTPEPTQQIAPIPSSFPTQIEQTLPPTPRLTQASQTPDGIDPTQRKGKTRDVTTTEPESQHERADTTLGDTTLVEPLGSQTQTLLRADPTSPSFSVKSIEGAKSPSPTFSERVRLYQSSQPDASQRSAFSQSQGLRTSLGYFTPLSSLPQHLNSQAEIDVLAVCTRATKRPERATAGPKDYFTSFRIADESLAAEASSVQVQVFRPWKAALPECDVGDAVLLRNFVPKSRKGKVGLISGPESAWCVFRYGKNLSQRAPAKQSQSLTQSEKSGAADGEDEVESGGKKGKRKSNIMDSLRPIWADTMSGLWGDLTGVVDGLDDDDDAKGTSGKESEKEAEETSNVEHGRYNPESGASREECHGPPVEYGDQERREARRLRAWWVGGIEAAKVNGDV